MHYPIKKKRDLDIKRWVPLECKLSLETVQGAMGSEISAVIVQRAVLLKSSIRR